MVLSNKKLKQKLRAQLVESLAQSASQTNESFKSLLISSTQKPKLSKREKRRVKAPSIRERSELEKTHKDGVKETESEEGSGGLKKNNKRKREKDEVDVKNVDEKKSKKKKKKKNKKKKVKKGEESVKQANGGSEEQVVTEPIQALTNKEDASISTKIYVGGIPYYSTVDDIRSYFEGCGSITEIDCLKFPETGKFNGIAMISFRTEAAAKRALALDGSDMGGLSLKIQPYKATRDKKVSDFSPAILDGYNRIYVGNLSWDITENELKKLFSDCTISSIRLGKDKETGEFRGFAHVDFADSLSLTMALKLDQKPLFGRPVRIRCAVPPKSVNPNSESESNLTKKVGIVKSNEFTSEKTAYDTVVNDSGAGKVKGRTCYECGEKGHFSSSCPKKEAADVAHTGTEYDDVVFDKDDTYTSVVADNVSGGKLKRRTCYECGEKGHLSSACPNKQAADMANDVAHKGTYGDDMVFDKADVADNVSDGKLKRRTSYECGEKGHLSSACPKKQVADVANSGKEANSHTFTSMVVVGKEINNKTVDSVSDGKLRRRTCFECGERGHLSSLCPKKQAADVDKTANDMEVEKAEELKNVTVVGKDDGNNPLTSVSGGKLRRRTCYECGEKGHLSSLCPNKKEADLENPGST